MSSTLGGRDPEHDLSPPENDKLEKELRAQGRAALREGRAKDRKKLDARAVEISRDKSKKRINRERETSSFHCLLRKTWGHLSFALGEQLDGRSP
jgi:hypothetical protein